MSSAGSAQRYETVNCELLTLTYGAIISQLLKDFEDPKEVNVQLEQMGYNIGVRLVDEFCAKSRSVRCRSFRESMETVAKEAFKMFLGVTAAVEAFAADGSACTLRIPDNPLAGERGPKAGQAEQRRPGHPCLVSPLPHSLSLSLSLSPPVPSPPPLPCRLCGAALLPQ
jgi:hypothetical protein